MKLREFILEKLVVEASHKNMMKRDEIVDFIKNSKYSDIFRDESDMEDCPEMHGNKTTLVVKLSSNSNELCLNELAMKRRDLINIVADMGGELEGDLNDALRAKDIYFAFGDKTLKCHFSGQGYSTNPGAGNRGTTSNNGGAAFEKLVGETPEFFANLCKKIAEKVGLKSDVDVLSGPITVDSCGGVNSKTNITLTDDFFKRFNRKSLTQYAQAIADVKINGLPISLKSHRKADLTTLWNFSAGETVKGDVSGKARNFIKNFIDDDEIMELVNGALLGFFPNNKTMSKDEWNEVKKANMHKSELKRGIELKKGQYNEDNIIKTLQQAWREGYYYVVEENDEDYVGFFVDGNSVDKLIGSVKKVTVNLPYTSKLLGITAEMSNGLTYEIRVRDRSAKMDFTAAEVISPMELTTQKMKQLKLSGFTEEKI